MIVVSVALALHLVPLPDQELMFSWPLALDGEVWRLVTPIFLHADLSTNPLHLIFNMMWLFDLGTLIERRLGSLRYISLVLLIAVASNIGQFIHAGPNFVGMSGVVYGLLGYAWVRGRLDPTSGLYLRGQVVVFMMAWLVACMIIEQLHVANAAHVVGLAAGCLLGYLSYAIGRMVRK
jgi:GlpG protein